MGDGGDVTGADDPDAEALAVHRAFSISAISVSIPRSAVADSRNPSSGVGRSWGCQRFASTAALRTPLRRATFATLIGLLAVTGIRVGEAIALNRDDLDLTAQRLLVRFGKFGKTRALALHPTTVEALRAYQRLHDRLAPATGTPALLVSTAGTRLIYCNVHHTFKQLAHLAGLRPRSGSCRPRIHDLRHSFAVRSMLDAYADGQDGQTRLTLLSTWLGHVHPASTYWYLSASPELMAAAGQRLDAYLADQSAGRP